MTAIVALYNSLPTLQDAEDRFTDREKTFTACRALLAQYQNIFGLRLVHAHCHLTDGEIMLRQANVSQTVQTSELDVEYFPERWLASAAPYEFTTQPTVAPPPSLIDKFNKIVDKDGTVGLYHIDKEEDDKPGKVIERTEGRKNILEPYTDADKVHIATQTETAWDLGSFDPVTMACNSIILCDSRTTRTGVTHKEGIKSTIHQS